MVQSGCSQEPGTSSRRSSSPPSGCTASYRPESRRGCSSRRKQIFSGIRLMITLSTSIVLKRETLTARSTHPSMSGKSFAELNEGHIITSERVSYLGSNI